MTTRQLLSSALRAPQGARCSYCGAPALVQCRCCEQTVCLAHAVFFVTVGCSPHAADLASVECLSCDEQEEPKAAESSDLSPAAE
jgi:hypothetical protein